MYSYVLSIYLSIYPSIYLFSIYLSIYLPIYSIYLSIDLSIYTHSPPPRSLTGYLELEEPVREWRYLSIYLSIHQSIYLPFYLMLSGSCKSMVLALAVVRGRIGAEEVSDRFM